MLLDDITIKMLVKLTFLLVLGLAFEKVYADEPDSVVGGSNANTGEFPYQASIRYYGGHICGGSIVSDRHIITAAHCVDDIANGPFKDTYIVTGAVKLDSPLGNIHRIKSVLIHPGYIPDRAHAWVNDAAIITLTKPMEFNAYQRPIPLATSDPPANAALTLSGWGQLGALEDSPNHLQKATAYYISNEQCQKLHRFMPLAPTHLCTLQVRGIGACQGDSGGPLAYNGELVGIVSWVRPCARGVPDVYTRVASYDSFFADAMKA